MNEDILVNYYTIGDIDYIIINEVDYNNFHYVYLVNENDNEDILIRKDINGILYPLDSENELNTMLKFIIKD